MMVVHDTLRVLSEQQPIQILSTDYVSDTLSRSKQSRQAQLSASANEATKKGRIQTKKMGQTSIKAIALAVLASSVTLASAQACIPLAGTELCPAFASASISTNKNLTDL